MKKPFGLQIHITDMCDQKCKHCYIYAGESIACVKKLSIEQLKTIVDNFYSFCMKMNVIPHMAVTGGDPLMHPNIWEMLAYMHQYGINFGILGNPFHLTPDVAQHLKELGCTFYQMSIDGLKKTHDYIRRPGSFDATLEKIPVIREAGIHSTIMTTISKTNIEEIPELIDIIVDNHVDTFSFARYCPNPDDIALIPSPEEYRTFLEKMWKKYEYYTQKKVNTSFSLKDHLWKLFLYEKGIFQLNQIVNEKDLILDGCHCGISHITVLSDGQIYACRRSETPIGDALKESFYDVFWGEKMDAYRQYDKFEACSQCELKNYCRGCPSVAKCATGNFYAKDPQCWKTFA